MHSWFRRGTPYGLANLADDIVNIYAGYPFELGENNGTDSFAPLNLDISSMTPNQVMCLVLVSLWYPNLSTCSLRKVPQLPQTFKTPLLILYSFYSPISSTQSQGKPSPH